MLSPVDELVRLIENWREDEDHFVARFQSVSATRMRIEIRPKGRVALARFVRRLLRGRRRDVQR
jgi:hypothetical protein